MLKVGKLQLSSIHGYKPESSNTIAELGQCTIHYARFDRIMAYGLGLRKLKHLARIL